MLSGNSFQISVRSSKTRKKILSRIQQTSIGQPSGRVGSDALFSAMDLSSFETSNGVTDNASSILFWAGFGSIF